MRLGKKTVFVRQLVERYFVKAVEIHSSECISYNILRKISTAYCDFVPGNKF